MYKYHDSNDTRIYKNIHIIEIDPLFKKNHIYIYIYYLSEILIRL